MNEPKPRFFRLLLTITLMAIAWGLAVTFFKERMVELTGLDSGYLVAFRYLTICGVWLLWIVWTVLCSGWKRAARFGIAGSMIALPVIFLSLFSIRFRGDVAIDGLNYRFSKPVELKNIDRVGTGLIVLDETLPGSFPGFLGPHRDGVIPDLQLNPDRDLSALELLWKQPIGPGWSGTSIAGEFLVTMEQRGNEECITCYRLANGEPVWIYSHSARFEDYTSMGHFGPRSTPQIFDGNVYAQGAAGHLIAIEGSTGRELWKVDLCDLLGIERTQGTTRSGFRYSAEPGLPWGRSASPVVTEKLVIIAGGKGATLMAFDRETGKEIWRSGEEMIAYGSPRIADIAGRNQILLQAESLAMGFDAASGQQLWSYSRPGNSAGDANCSQVTVVDGQHLLFSKGYLAGGEMVEIVETGGSFSARTVWKNPRVLRTKLTNPVIHNGFAYSISEGFLECTQLSDGARIWKRRGPYGDGQLLLAGEWLVVHGEKGKLQLVRASPETKPDATDPVDTIGGICWNTLAISGDRLVLRSDSEISCWQLPVLDATELIPDSLQ